MSPAGYKYDLYCGTRTDITSAATVDEPAASLDACVTLCDNDNNCIAWNYFNNGRCQTFWGTGELTLVTDCNSYVTGRY
jgi:hypothetical protein